MAELALDFTPVTKADSGDAASTRPTASYWQDAWRRLRANPRAIASLWVVVALILFTLIGPFLWQIDPSAQDLDQVSQPPGLGASATIVGPFQPWAGVTVDATRARSAAPSQLRTHGTNNTQSVRLSWAPAQAAHAYRIYRAPYRPNNAFELGLPLAETASADHVSFEDRLDLQPKTYYYSVIAMQDGRETGEYVTLPVAVGRAITLVDARNNHASAVDGLGVGDELRLQAHPLGTDYLGRDMLARLMHGARISLFVGVVAPLLFVFLGVAYGALAGFVGGAVDSLLMRFADFVVALPFLLFMILFRISFGTQSGESGILPMLIAMVLLSWPSTARLVRGQILQIREEGYVQAARLLGAPTGYLIFRHMIPNTFGVILVTFTFAVPSAIFTEAFLSFIGMGVAPPTPSWGSMCNEGLKTMLTTPHELIAPALLISITVLAFNMLGDGLRDALDARMRSTE